MIQWEYFFDTTSSREALWDFIEATIDLDKLKQHCWSNACKEQVNKMRHLQLKTSVGHVEDLAVQALRRRGYTINRVKNPRHERPCRYLEG